MNPVIYEQIMSLLGLIALWAFWYYLWKPQRVDIFRQKLFALRSDLFDLADNGTVPFDHPAYTQLRLMINGLIRFAHRASLPTLIVAMVYSRNAPSDAMAMTLWMKNVQKLPNDKRNQLLAVHTSVSMALAKHLIGGSLILSTYVLLRVSIAVTKSFVLLLIGKRSIRNYSFSQALNKMDREKQQVAKPGTDAIEAHVLNEEQRRSSMKLQHAFAH
jgi:hypothetical protein